MVNQLFQVLLIGCLQLITSGSSPPPTLIANPLINSGNNGMPLKSNNDGKQDSTPSASNEYPQYLVPPPIAYPPPATSGQYSNIPQQYQMQNNPQLPLQANPYAEIKSDISTLRDTVMLLSNVMVKQNSINGRGMMDDQVEQESNGRARNFNSYGSPSSNQNNYHNNNNNQNYQNNNYQQGPSQGHQSHHQGNNNYGPGDKAQTGGYDGPPIQIEVYQSKKEYDEPKVIKDAPKQVATADPPKAHDTSLASLFPKLSAAHAKVKTNVVAHAERTFAIIKRGIRNALVTGVIVALVRLVPLLWVGLRLIFNAILPLVGISLHGTNQLSNVFSLSADTTKTVAADTTPAPATRTLISNDGLDEELANLESNFDIFKGRMF